MLLISDTVGISSTHGGEDVNFCLFVLLATSARAIRGLGQASEALLTAWRPVCPGSLGRLLRPP